jgi:hypothetical protein
MHHLHVELKDVHPPVWRDLRVPSDTTLEDLHRVFQAAFGWEDCHLHAFRRLRPATEIRPFTQSGGVERHVRLRDVAPRKGARLLYEYDFGDSWEHIVTVREISPWRTHRAGPAATCVGGMRAAPPEDCGGPGGYAHLLHVLQDRRHPEHAEMRTWVGGKLDPDAFSLAHVNRALRHMRHEVRGAR